MIGRFNLLAVFLFFCIFSFSNLIAQQEDLGLWTSVNLDKELADNLSVSVQQAFRFRDNAIVFDKAFTEFSLSYRLLKPLKLTLAYRHSTETDKSQSVRFALDARLKKRWKPINVAYRVRLQDRIDNEGGLWYLRHKVTLSYSRKKHWYMPFVAAESFSELYVDSPEFDRYRLIAGNIFDVGKRKELKVAYMFQQEINVTRPQRQHIIAFSYSYRFK